MPTPDPITKIASILYGHRKRRVYGDWSGDEYELVGEQCACEEWFWRAPLAGADDAHRSHIALAIIAGLDGDDHA